MAKKRKKKFNKKSSFNQVKQPSSASSVQPKESGLNISDVVAVGSQITQPAVKKQDSIYTAHAKEYRFITGDLYRVLIVNGIFFIGIMALYYVNKSNPFLQTWYDKIF